MTTTTQRTIHPDTILITDEARPCGHQDQMIGHIEDAMQAYLMTRSQHRDVQDHAMTHGGILQATAEQAQGDKVRRIEGRLELSQGDDGRLKGTITMGAARDE